MKNQIKPGFFGIDAPADARRREFDIMNEQYLYSKKKADVVFFGDSITQHWDLNLYFNPNVLKMNRGIGGDRTFHAARRFDADVLQLDAKIIIILLGINDLILTAPDLWWREPGRDKDEIIKGIEENFKEMLQKSKDKDVYVYSLLPQNIAPAFDKNEFKDMVLETNKILKKLAKEHGAEYVDYYSALEKDGFLPDDMSSDGIHPNGKCYEIMANLLKEKIDIL